MADGRRIKDLTEQELIDFIKDKENNSETIG